MGLRLCRGWPHRTCVSIKVFTGAFPFSEKRDTAAMFEIMNGGRPPRPTIPVIAERLWSLMERCWDSEPHLRPEISEALEILLDASVSCLFYDYLLFALTAVSCTVTYQRRMVRPHEILQQRIDPAESCQTRLHQAPPLCKSSTT